MNKTTLYLTLFAGIVLIIAFLGPKPTYKSFDNKPSNWTIEIAEVENYIQKKESAFQNLKTDNEARIIWADTSSREKTKPWVSSEWEGLVRRLRD